MFSVHRIRRGVRKGRASHTLDSASFRQHFISFIKTEELDFFCIQCSVLDHVKQAARCAHNDVNTCLQLSNILVRPSSSDARVASDIHVLPDVEYHLLDLLGQLASWCEDKRLRHLRGYVQL